MSKADVIEIEGTVIEKLPNAKMCIRDRDNGKGIKYSDEVIRRKVGKTGKK